MASIKDNILTSVKEGSIVNFKAIAQTPLKSLRVNFTPIQQGEGDPSPENIRAIKGWTDIIVNHSDTDLSPHDDPENPAVLYKYNSSRRVVYDNTEQAFWTGNTGVGVAYANHAKLNTTNVGRTAIFVAPQNMTVTLSFDYKNIGTGYGIRIYTWNRGRLEDVHGDADSVWHIYSRDIELQKGDGLHLIFYENIYWRKLRVTYGSPVKAYGQYIGKTYPITFSTEVGIVYGGYVDVTNGKVQKTLHNIDLGTLNWTVYETGSNVYWANIPLPTINGNNGTPIQLYCSALLAETLEKTIGYITGSMPVNNIAIRASVPGRIYIKSDAGSASAVKESLNGVIAVYELATPIEYDIDPITIKTLIGTNNIYSNADSVNVEYYNLESLNLYKQRFKANQPYLQTASGSVASFQTALKAPLKECKVYFSPVQDQGAPSPDNVLPISGWTGFDLYMAGKNILPHGNFSRATNGITYNLRDDGSLTIDGQSTGNAWLGVPKSLYFRLPINTYTLSGNTLGYSATGYRHYMVATQVNGHSLEKYDLGSGVTFTPDYAFDTVRLQAWVLSNKTISNKTVYPQLEVGSEATEFEEPVTKKSSITFPSSVGTVYGGYVDLISGEIIQTMGYKHFDENDNWQLGSSTSHSPYRYYVTSVQPSNGIYEAVVSDKLAPYLGWDPYPYMATLNNGGHLVIGAPEELSTVDAFKAWLQEVGGVDVVYPLVTPIHYPLDPMTIKTLKGINNIWSNTNGNIQTKYWTYGSLAKRKTLTWNQWIPQLISENWQPQNIDYSTLSIDNNIATINIIQDVTAVYQSSMKSKKENVPWILDHKYYIRQDINPSQDSEYVIIRYNSWVGGKRCLKDEWTTLKVVTTSTTTSSNTIYLGYCSVVDQSPAGKVTKVKNPMIVDLTQMFGEGNEPTLQEFESLCARNGIDLTQYQPYDEGSIVNWYV